jgi:hypothetical protein
MPDDDIPESLPRIGVPVLCYVAATLGAILVWTVWRPEGLALAVTIAVPVAALGWLIGRGFARRRAGSCSTPAQRAYVRRFVPMMIAYVVILLGAIWLKKNLAPSGPVTALLAILSAVPLIGVVWAMGRMLIEETDEYQRMLLARQIIVATGFMLSVTSVWGFLEDFGQVPHVPMYWAFIIWCAGLGIGSAVNEIKS